MSKSLIKDIGSLSILSLVGTLSPIIVFPIIVANLGVEKYGEFYFYLSFSQLINILQTLGHVWYVVPYAASLEDNGFRKKVFISNAYVVSVAIAAIASVMILFLSGFSFKMVCALSVSFTQLIVPQWYYQATNQLMRFSGIMIVNRIVISLAIISLVSQFKSLESLLISYLIGFIFTGLITVFSVKKHFLSFRYCKISIAKTILFNSMKYFGGRMAAMSYTNGVAIFLGALNEPLALGMWAMFDRIKNLLNTINSAFSNSLISRTSSTTSTAEHTRLLKTTLFWRVVASVSTGLILIVVLPWIIKVFENQIEINDLRLLIIMAICVIIVLSFIDTIGVQWFLAKRRYNTYFYSIICAALVNALLYIFLFNDMTRFTPHYIYFLSEASMFLVLLYCYVNQSSK